MSDVMLHGVLNMPLPDDPTESDLLTWVQFKDRARQASARIEELEAKLAKAVEALDEAVYLLAPTEKDMERQAGIYRIVTTLAALKGQDDD